MTLGIADNGRPDLTRYIHWVSRLAPELHWVRLSSQRGNALELEQCSGLILTGGGDVHPRFYGREDASDLMKSVDVQRDEFEFELVRSALTMQVFNVATGGTMIPDVERAGFRNHRKNEDGSDRLHSVRVEKETAIFGIIGADGGEVNIDTTKHFTIKEAYEKVRVFFWKWESRRPCRHERTAGW